jgi:hypothetical protein
MKTLYYLPILLLLVFSKSVTAQKIKFRKSHLEPISVLMSHQKLMGKKVVRVMADTTIKTFDEPTFVKIRDVDFQNGTIEVKVLSRLIPNAPDWARGFIGLAFRIDDKNTAFESIYIRPTILCLSRLQI